MARRDDLALLGLELGATRSDIRTAYRAKALSHHPDRGGDPELMASISEAYERVLAPEPIPASAAFDSHAPDDIDDTPDDYTIGHSMLAFVAVPIVLAVILMLGVFSVLSTIL